MSQVDPRNQMIQKLTIALKQCQELLVEMRDRQSSLKVQLKEARTKQTKLSQQLKQKIAIIDKLICEKQQRILQPSLFTDEAYKEQLRQANQFCRETHQSCNATLQNSQESLRRCRKELQILKEVNKMLRTDNQRLRREIQQGSSKLFRKGEGSIVTRQHTKREQTSNVNNLKIAQNKGIGDVSISPDVLFTPQRISTWKSTVLPSTYQKTQSPVKYSNSQQTSRQMGQCVKKLMELFTESESDSE